MTMHISMQQFWSFCSCLLLFTIINMNNNFEVESVSETNILHTQCSKLVNYGAKMLKVSGPFLWNSLPDYIRNSKTVFTLKSSLKKYFIGQYETDLSVSGYYYVSKLSLCYMKITISKMQIFHIPPFLPSRLLQVRNISNDGMKIKIFKKQSVFFAASLVAAIFFLIPRFLQNI